MTMEVTLPEFGVPELMTQIHEEIAHRRTKHLPFQSAHFSDLPTDSLVWDQIDTHLQRAEQHAYIGRSVPKMRRFPYLVRHLGRLVARCYLYLSQVITKGQREFNVSTVRSIRDLVSTVKHLVNEDNRNRTLLEELNRQMSAVLLQETGHVLAPEAEHSIDRLYVAFENRFRGSREEIKKRLAVYLPHLSPVARAAGVVDIGCGRGEWLELLRENGIPGRGVDLNRTMAEECRNRGHDVYQGDSLDYLEQLPDACLGAVTGFHIIEHLPWRTLLCLIDEIVRVLAPGGVMVFETPNPENISVGSCNFWADLTHRRPLFPPTVQFLAEQRGLVNVEILRLNSAAWQKDPLQLLPAEHALAPTLNPLIELMKQRFFAAPDFAVIGSKV
jgi:O-antigen chain-terminating methyltransferase